MSKGDQVTMPDAGQANPSAIAKRAYELYLQRGSVPGHELEDWLQAEVELTARLRGEQEKEGDVALSEEASGPPAGDSTPSSGPAIRRPARDRGGSRRPARPQTSH